MNKENCREIYKYRDEIYNIASFAVKAMLYEVSAFPKPGLVTPVSNGAHEDMNYFTFIDSTCALMETMIKFSEVGFSSKGEKEIFKEAREIGKIGDKHMLQSTNGVNTHKGMIFLMGLCCIAVAKDIYEEKNFDEIENIIKRMTRGIVKEDLEEAIKGKDHEALTYGELLYKNYGIKGIRGEVEMGMPIVFTHSLKIYEENNDLDTNDRLVHTLIAIMSCCEDTNVIHRHNIEVLKEVQNKAKYIMKIGGMQTKNGRKAVEDLSTEFINRNISPGGCADLLAVTVFFSLVKEKYGFLED
ncbi:triphosphoribosyl-dephospho-CoA synthase CitG [Haloimpatiens massiliensis]|uniref:triphosphoribosyl-dephospho-CoA synthase CitG n=1 Tax=Haloimpatiens massiliensis TaxID=1658110 RepID=UPI000C84E00D|nr:triphosphoribosyl-dephospho-CoA synthase CitG [Haloimpatiens massiliensis]